MGDKPLPIEVHQARGINGRTLGGREIDVTDVSKLPTVLAPPAPEGLALRGRQEWLKIWQAGKWLWPEQDYPWVEQIVRAYDDIDAFRASIADEGLMVPGYRPGMTVANPLISEIRKAEDTIRKCLSQLGFSPTDRARLKLTELKGESELQKLTAGAPSKAPGSVIQSYVEGEW